VEGADVIDSPEEPNPPSTPSDLSYSPGWDPDDDQAMQTRFLRIIIAEREKHHQQILLINKEKELIAQERRNLELEKKQLDYERHNLEARLAELEKYRDILPSTKQLREMGVDLVGVSIWIETIRDKAATEGIDHKSAVSLIVQDLKLYNQYNTLQKAIHKRQQDLEALDIVVEQKQQVVVSLVDLNSKGTSDTDLVEKNALIHSWSANRGAGSSQNNSNMNGLRLDDKLNLASPNGKNNLQPVAFPVLSMIRFKGVHYEYAE
jgi:hypothetical protein